MEGAGLPMRWKSLLGLGAIVLAISACASDLKAAGDTAKTPLAKGVKWHPGHYMMVKTAATQKEYVHPSFLGIQKFYYWKNLEPAQGRYDFSEIKSDLAFLGKHGKRLVIQIQTKAFGEGANVAPACLKNPEFGGGLYKTTTGSYNPVIWNDKVNARLLALYRALGKEFNSDPYLEAVVIPETAPSSSIARGTPQPGVEPFTIRKFVDALKIGMKTLKDAFLNTVVIQYTNFPPEALQELTDYQKEIGVGLGGPDIRPYDTGLSGSSKGVYRFYPQLSGIVPLGTAVQSEDYVRKTRKGPLDPTPVNEIYEFGRDKLHLNYIFWLDKPRYFDKVEAMMKSPWFPKDPAGGLDARCPKTIAPRLGEDKP